MFEDKYSLKAILQKHYKPPGATGTAGSTKDDMQEAIKYWRKTTQTYSMIVICIYSILMLCSLVLVCLQIKINPLILGTGGVLGTGGIFTLHQHIHKMLSEQRQLEILLYLFKQTELSETEKQKLVNILAAK